MGIRRSRRADVLDVTEVAAARRPLDYIRDAVATGLYWTTSRRPDGSWIVHKFNDNTGIFTEPIGTSPILDSNADPFFWTPNFPDLGALSIWHPWDDDGTSRNIEGTHRLVNELRAPRRRPGTHVEAVIAPYPENAPLIYLTAFERWIDSGQAAPPSMILPLSAQPDVPRALDEAAARMGVDPAGWIEITPGQLYRHE